MLKQIILSVLLIIFISCEKDDNSQNELYYSNSSKLISSGTFMPTTGITVSGEAKIYSRTSSKKVVLENFSVSNGPDLKVYLSKTAEPTDFVSLGNLTSEAVYTIPQEVNLSQYQFVLIHCEINNHLFAIAELN